MENRRSFVRKAGVIAAGSPLLWNPRAKGANERVVLALRLRRDVVFDPKTETFRDDKAANAWLTKQYRSPYELPKV